MATCQISIGIRIFPFDGPQNTGYFVDLTLNFGALFVRKEDFRDSIRLHERIRNQAAELLGSKEHTLKTICKPPPFQASPFFLSPHAHGTWEIRTPGKQKPTTH